MNERKQLTQEQIDKLNEPLPPEAIKPHPTKSFLSAINSIYVTERLNDVFGVGMWTIKTEHVATEPSGKSKMVVCKTTIEVAEYGIHFESYGGNDNPDIGDAFKGAVTDAITKMGSWMGIGANVWKNKPGATAQPKRTAVVQAQAQPTPEQQMQALIEQLKKCSTRSQMVALWNQNPALATNDTWVVAFQEHGKKIGNK